VKRYAAFLRPAEDDGQVVVDKNPAAGVIHKQDVAITKTAIEAKPREEEQSEGTFRLLRLIRTAHTDMSETQSSIDEWSPLAIKDKIDILDGAFNRLVRSCE